MQEKYLKIISYEAERLEKLTRGLLTLNELDIQKRMLHIQPFDINSVIKATAASFEGLLYQSQYSSGTDFIRKGTDGTGRYGTDPTGAV